MRNARARGSPRVRLVSSIAMLVVAIGGVGFYSIRKTHDLLDTGVKDHARCAIAGAYLRPTPAAPIVEGLGAPLDSLADALLQTMPGDGLISAHRCVLEGRFYSHVILRRNQILVSVILTRAGENEIFPRSLTGGLLHEGERQGYAVAGFGTGGYLGYVVSALPGDENAQLAGKLAPVVERYTAR